VTKSNLSDAFRKPRVATVAEWRASGLTQAQFRSLARSGDLVRVRHAVYATRTAAEWAKASPARGHALQAMAARAALGTDSVASHHSAALIHGLDLYPAAPPLVTLTRPPARRCNRPESDGVLFHAAELPDRHVTTLLGVRVTTVPRTVVDLARVSSFMSAVVTADSALRADPATSQPGFTAFTTRGALVAACDACAGWPGIQRARRVAGFSDPRAGSVLESCARVTFHEHGLDPPELQHTVTGPDFRYTVDFYWPRHQVIAEADGTMKYAEFMARVGTIKAKPASWKDLFFPPIYSSPGS